MRVLQLSSKAWADGQTLAPYMATAGHTATLAVLDVTGSLGLLLLGKKSLHR